MTGSLGPTGKNAWSQGLKCVPMVRFTVPFKNTWSRGRRGNKTVTNDTATNQLTTR